jgi:hypothetical protein
VQGGVLSLDGTRWINSSPERPWIGPSPVARSSVACFIEDFRGVPMLLQNSVRLLIERMSDRITFRGVPSAENPYPQASYRRNRVLCSLARSSSKRLLQQNLPGGDVRGRGYRPRSTHSINMPFASAADVTLWLE